MASDSEPREIQGQRRPRRGQRAVLAEIAAAKAAFEDAVRTARVSGAALPEGAAEIVRQALGADAEPGEFDRLLAAARRGDRDGEELSRRAAGLARLRAYVLPVETLPIEARAACAEMKEWQVPQSVLAEVQQSLGEIARCAGPQEQLTARAAMKQILETYDYWDWYTDWFFGQMRRVLLLLGLLFTASVLGAFASFGAGHGLTGFVIAGLAGTAVSVMLKMPSLSVYGEVASFAVKVVGRLAAGVAACAIGGGLLSIGVFNVPLSLDGKALSFTALLGQCGGGCTPFATMILMAIGMLLGFTERALGTFEDALFGAGAKRPPTE